MADYKQLNLGGYDDYASRVLGGGNTNYLQDYLNSLNGGAPAGGTLASLNTQLSTKPYQMPWIQMNGTYGEAPSGWNGGAPNYAPDGAGTYLPATGSGATAPIGAPGTGFDSDWYNNAFNNLNPGGVVLGSGARANAGVPAAGVMPGYTGNNMLTGAGSMTANDVMQNTYGPGSTYGNTYGPAGPNSGANTLTGAGSLNPADVMLKTYGGSGMNVAQPDAQPGAAAAPAPSAAYTGPTLTPGDAWSRFFNKGTGW